MSNSDLSDSIQNPYVLADSPVLEKKIVQSDYWGR